MVPVAKMETEEPLACRCVFRGLPGRGGPGGLGAGEHWLLTLLCHRGRQVFRAQSDRRESPDPRGPQDR